MLLAIVPFEGSSDRLGVVLAAWISVAGKDRGVALDPIDAEAVQTRVRRRILRAFSRRVILGKDERNEIESWDHGGGFSLDATVRSAADDRRGLERLLRYCARPPQRLGTAR